MERVDFGQQTVSDYTYGRRRSSGSRWRGVSLESGCADSPELPEGYLTSCGVTLFVKAPKRMELYVPDQGWGPARRVWNTVSFFPAEMPYACRCDGPLEGILIQFSADFLKGDEGSTRVDGPAPPTYWSIENSLLAEIILALNRDVAAGSPSGPLYGECLGAAFIAHLRKEYSRRTTTLDLKRLGLPERLARVLEYMNDNLASDLSLLSLADMMHISAHHFLRLFKQYTGMSPHQYVLRKRVERAAGLLGDTKRTIADVALQTGFSDQSHFSTSFRRLMGVSPRAYRQLRIR